MTAEEFEELRHGVVCGWARSPNSDEFVCLRCGFHWGRMQMLASVNQHPPIGKLVSFDPRDIRCPECAKPETQRRLEQEAMGDSLEERGYIHGHVTDEEVLRIAKLMHIESTDVPALRARFEKDPWAPPGFWVEPPSSETIREAITFHVVQREPLLANPCTCGAANTNTLPHSSWCALAR